LPIDVAVDPALGRLAFPASAIPATVRVSYAYGFSGDVGSGPYNRSASITQTFKGPVTWQRGVSQSIPPVPDQIVATLAEAVQAWNAQPAGTVGLITIMDSSTYTENLTGPNVIEIPEGSQLVLAAADWPTFIDPISLVETRQVGAFSADRLRPHIDGNISVRGVAPDSSVNPGELALNGLLIEGRLTALAGNLGGLRISHCTLVPTEGGVTINIGGADQQNAQLAVAIERSICGSVMLAQTTPALSVIDSILDNAGSGSALTAPGADVTMNAATLFGPAGMRSLEASNSLFTALATVERRQAGCIRYSFTPDGSQTPRRFRCQPDLALDARAEALGLDSSADLSPAQRALVLSRVKPEYTSEQYGDPEYAQLSLGCAEEILTGADDGAEMGAFQHLQQPQRAANLRESLGEYLRFGLEAGIFFVT
jgi:hypothetical protein